MAALTGRQIQATKGEILTIDTSNSQVVDTTLRPVASGDGTASALYISTLAAKSNGLIIGGGTYGAGTDMPDSGARTGFYWYPKKGAVLGGVVSGTQWDNANIGNYAVALGQNSKASGLNSSALGGYSNVASGSYSSVAGGYENNATQTYAHVGGGLQNTASGEGACAVGGAVNSATSTYSAVVGGSACTASAIYSGVFAGVQNTASAQGSFVVGGATNVSSEQYSGCVGGQYGVANKFGQVVQACSDVSNPGNRQTSVLCAGIQTIDVTPNELFLNGASSYRITLANDSTYGFLIYVTARRTDANDESAFYKFEGCIDRNATAATTALVGSVTKTVIAEDTAAWDADVTADTTNGSLKITVTGQNAKTIQWTARIELIEAKG